MLLTGYNVGEKDTAVSERTPDFGRAGYSTQGRDLRKKKKKGIFDFLKRQVQLVTFQV